MKLGPGKKIKRRKDCVLDVEGKKNQFSLKVFFAFCSFDFKYCSIMIRLASLSLPPEKKTQNTTNKKIQPKSKNPKPPKPNRKQTNKQKPTKPQEKP